MGEKYSQRAHIVLASASPRRKELLESLGLSFDVRPADIDEDIHIDEPAELVKELSKRKAAGVKAEGACVIGSDTVVYARGKMYGKPHTEDRAREMLGELEGRWHTVYTGVTVLYGGERRTFSVSSRVKFKRMSAADIDRYVREKKPLDKAGAYGIQDGEVVEGYKGSYSNIVGLPLERLTKIMERMGVIYVNS